MKKKSNRRFMRGFVKTGIYLLFFILLFLSGYKITILYLKYHNKTAETKNGAVNITTEGKATSVAYNLVFAIDEDAGCLKHMVLEVLNTNTDNLSYVTIPLNCNITLSSELYNSARNKNSEIPQIIKFNELGDFMETADFYEFSTAVLEDYLDLDISFFTVVQNDDFNLLFKKDKDENCYVFKNTLKTEVDGFTEDDIIKYMKAFYKKTTSNIELSERLKYTSSLSEVKMDEIAFVCIPGESVSGTYQIDKDKANELFQILNDGGSLEDIKNITGEAEAVSLEKNIEILNGSRITGLAAGYKDTLEKAGYTVTGIANYESSDIADTIIQVKEEGMGTDLQQYFHNAEIELTNDMPENIDIQVILGASEIQTD